MMMMMEDDAVRTSGRMETWLNNALPGASETLTITGKGSRVRMRLNPPLEFDTRNHAGYEMALLRLETYYSFPNLDATNNHLRISLDRGRTWIEIVIPIGCYDITAINKFVQRVLVEHDKKAKAKIIIEANPNTLKCVLDVKSSSAVVDFNVASSLRSVLGFTKDTYTGPGRYESETLVNILNVNSILVQCDCIGSSRVNGVPVPVIYNFFPDVSPGDKIVSQPQHLIYMPISMDVISSICCWLTDQSLKDIDLRGEELTLTFHIRKKR